MKKNISIIIILCMLHFASIAQKQIIYRFEQVVMDSLHSGIVQYKKLYKKAEKDLKLYAVVVEQDNEFEIYLQEYSHLSKSGLLQLIKTTNRRLQINNTFTVPIIIPADKISLQIKMDKIFAIPLSGFYLKVVYDNYVQKVQETAMLF